MAVLTEVTAVCSLCVYCCRELLWICRAGRTEYGRDTSSLAPSAAGPSAATSVAPPSAQSATATSAAIATALFSTSPTRYVMYGVYGVHRTVRPVYGNRCTLASCTIINVFYCAAVVSCRQWPLGRVPFVVVESGMPVIARLLTGRVQGLPICCTPRTVFAVQLAPRTVIAVLGSVPYVV